MKEGIWKVGATWDDTASRVCVKQVSQELPHTTCRASRQLWRPGGTSLRHNRTATDVYAFFGKGCLKWDLAMGHEPSQTCDPPASES